MAQTRNNAIIMAAGMSARFAPLSYETPKGLLEVQGEILIERQIRQLKEVGIFDISVVVGYMAEKFEYLKAKYGVDIVFNPNYNRYNNTATLMCVVDRLADTYICSSDNYFTQNVFESKVDGAYYAATFYPGKTNEWGLVTDDKGLIIGIDHEPIDRWCMMGHAFFSADFSRKFTKILIEEFKDEKVKNGYWEGVYERHIDDLSMFVRRYDSAIIREFDSLEDLRQFDTSYITDTRSSIIKKIGDALGCRDSDIQGISAIKNGISALSFAFTCRGKRYIYSLEDSTLKELT